MIHVYRSTDAGAPTLTGLAGSLISVLDACLVDGYGSKSPAGWSKAFFGTNKAAYRMPAGVTMRAYFRVEDGTYSGTIQGFETMTDVDTGPYPFPSATSYITKSTTASGASVAWLLITDGLTVYFFAYAAGSSANGVVFGEFLSFKPGDVSPVFVQGRGTGDFNANGVHANAVTARSGLGVRGVSDGCGLARAFSGEVGGAIFIPLSTAGARSTGTRLLSGFPGQEPYPNPVTNGFTAVPAYLWEQSGASYLMRGTYPGMYATIECTNTIADGSEVTGVSGLPGRTLMPVRIASGSIGPAYFALLFDITGPWQV